MAIFFAAEEAILPSACKFQSAQRNIIPATFHQHRAEFLWNDSVQQRNIFLDQLFLQRNRVRADDDTLLVIDHSSNRGNEICKTFSNAGASFDQQSSLAIKARIDRRCHFKLLRTMFKSHEAFRHGTSIRKNNRGLKRHHPSLRWRESTGRNQPQLLRRNAKSAPPTI